MKKKINQKSQGEWGEQFLSTAWHRKPRKAINQKSWNESNSGFLSTAWQKKPRKAINYSAFQSPHYFDQLFVLFLVVCFIFTLTVIDSSNGFSLGYVLKYVILFFLIVTISVLMELKNRSEYMTPMETIDVRQFFAEFNHSSKREEFVHKYNAKTLKQLKKNIKRDLKYQLTNVVKRNKVYELHIAEKPSGDKFYLLKLLMGKNNHKLTIQEEKGEIKILRIS